MDELLGQGDLINQLLEEALAQKGESQHFEFKKTLDLSREKDKVHLIRAAAAFSNTRGGGFLLVGVDSNAKPCGVDPGHLPLLEQSHVHRVLRAHLTPQPNFVLHQRVYANLPIVILRFEPFRDVPVFVANGFGNYKPGQILVRNVGAETLPASQESDIRQICDQITENRAENLAGIVRKTLLSSGTMIGIEPERVAGLSALRGSAGSYWGSPRGYIEVYFDPIIPMSLSPEQLRQVFPLAVVPTQFHGFPFYHNLPSWPGPSLKNFGWVATVPSRKSPDDPVEPDYMWALGIDGAFIDRDRYWEDDKGTRIQGGVGIMHLLTRASLLLRFLRRMRFRLGLSDGAGFVIGMRLLGAKARFLASEYAADTRFLPRAEGDDLEVQMRIGVSLLEEDPRQIVISLVEAMAWKMERTDLTRSDLSSFLDMAQAKVEPACAFPSDENVPALRPTERA